MYTRVGGLWWVIDSGYNMNNYRNYYCIAMQAFSVTFGRLVEKGAVDVGNIIGLKISAVCKLLSRQKTLINALLLLL